MLELIKRSGKNQNMHHRMSNTRTKFRFLTQKNDIARHMPKSFFESRSLLRSHISVAISHDITGGAPTCSAKKELSCDVFTKVIH